MTNLKHIGRGIILVSLFSQSLFAQRLAYYESGKKEAGIEAIAGGGSAGFVYNVAARMGWRPVNGLTTGIYLSYGKYGNSASRNELTLSGTAGGIYARYYLLQRSRISVFPQVDVGLANYTFPAESKTGGIIGAGAGISLLVGQQRSAALQLIGGVKPLGMGQLQGQSLPAHIRLGYYRTF